MGHGIVRPLFWCGLKPAETNEQVILSLFT